MGGELVDDSSTGEVSRGGEGRGSISDQFYAVLPFYLHIGMTLEQFWDGPAWLAPVYREKYDLDREARNQELWLQGLYNFYGFSTAVSNALRSKGTRARQYLEQPIRITPLSEEEKRRNAARERQKAVDYFSRWGETFQKQQSGGKGEKTCRQQ